MKSSSKLADTVLNFLQYVNPNLSIYIAVLICECTLKLFGSQSCLLIVFTSVLNVLDCFFSIETANTKLHHS